MGWHQAEAGPANEPRDRRGRWSGSGGETYLAAPADALAELAAGRTVTVAPEDVRGVLERAADSGEHPDLTLLTINGLPIFAGGLNQSRSAMPQIPEDHHKPFLASLRKAGVGVVRGSARPAALVPSQKEIDAANVGAKLRAHDNGERDLRPILVSKDNYVLDGHHRWAVMASLDAESPKAKITVPVIRIMAPHVKALDLMHAYTKRAGIKAKKMGESRLVRGWRGPREEAFGSSAQGHFNPQQPRMPAGDPKGGEWVAAAPGGAGGSSAAGIKGPRAEQPQGYMPGRGGPSVAGYVPPEEPKPASPDEILKAGLTPTPHEATSAKRIGGNHVNDAFHVKDKAGGDFMFKPDDHEKAYIHASEMDIEYDNTGITEGATLADREVIAGKIGQVIGLQEFVPDAHFGRVDKYEPGQTPAEKVEPPAIPSERLAAIERRISDAEGKLGKGASVGGGGKPSAGDWKELQAMYDERDRLQGEIRGNASVYLKGNPEGPFTTSVPPRSGVIGTTGGEFDWNQRLDAWGRPIQVGVGQKLGTGRGVGNLAIGKLVNEPSAPDNLKWENGQWVKTATRGGPSTPTPEPSSASASSSQSDEGSGGRSPYGRTGALIPWQSDATDAQSTNLKGTIESRAAVSTLDAIIGNMDRHGGNYMIEEDSNKMIAVDHGYAFPSKTKLSNDYGQGDLRSFMMAGNGQATPSPSWEKAMSAKIKAVDWSEFLKGSPLSQGEIDATVARADLVARELGKGTGSGLKAVQKILNFHW
jgi:hypothetical protein